MHIFNQAQTSGQRIAPGTSSAGTVFEVSNRFIPLPPSWEGVSLKHVATGEAKEFLASKLLDHVRGKGKDEKKE